MRFIWLLFFFATSAHAFTVGAVGDSITAGVNADRFGADKTVSWSTGTSVESHKSYIEAALGQPVSAFNESVSGSQVWSLPAQLDALLPRKPDYTTLMVGANDLCNWAPENFPNDLNSFKDSLRSSLSRLDAAGGKTLVVGLPDMLRLYELGSENGCQFLWDIVGFCGPLLSSQRTALERQQFGERLQTLNNGIGEVASEFQSVAFADILIQSTFERSHVSALDCFHPSREGQGFLSERTFAAAKDLLDLP